MQLLPLKYPKKVGLIGHTIINYPNFEQASAIIDVLVKNHVDMIELQIPFSEPIADGPIFVKANHEAIKNGCTVEQCYEFMFDMSSRYSIPFIFMTYANIVYKQGFYTFIKKAKEAGARGAIIPDLPLDLADDYVKLCRDHQFAAISVVSPNISNERLKTLTPFFDGFIYAVARSGVTGSKTVFDEKISHYLNKLRHCSNLPLAVGFGISSSADLFFLQGKADYAVVGTQTVRIYEQQGIEGVAKFWQELAGPKNCASRENNSGCV